MDIEKTKAFYERFKSTDLCDCAYCQNYVREIKAAYPKVAEYLACLGVDIEKPFETMPLEPDGAGNMEYICAQYIVCGEPDDFAGTVIDSVSVDVAQIHPSTQVEQAHFVMEIHPVCLKWGM